MEAELFLLKCWDIWNRNSSEKLIGIFDSEEKAIHAAQETDGYNLNQFDIDCLKLHKATQKTQTEVNYKIEKIMLNQIN